MTKDTKDWLKFYVLNPIGIRGVEHVVSVEGYSGKRGDTPPGIIERQHVISIHPSQEDLIERWTRNICIEPYKASVHKDAILTQKGQAQEQRAIAQREQHEKIQAQARKEAMKREKDETANKQRNPIKIGDDEEDDEEDEPGAVKVGTVQSKPIDIDKKK